MDNLFFLSIQGSYSLLDISLFNNSNIIKNIKEDNFKASSLLIPIIQNLLKENNLKLENLAFIATDQGPGAFTSLRVTISTVNGLSFASKIPLIGIDGLDAISTQALKQIQNLQKTDVIVALLNAYNDDVYYKINSDKVENQKGYKKIDLLLSDLKNNFENQKIIFIGNAVNLHKDKILNIFDKNSAFIDIQNASSQEIALIALDKFEKDKNCLSFKLTPLYLKSQNFAIRPTKK
ncbi:tRNA (adenosine(37)-N6)-threonylcarbamoyltransferase complex dimerization subunit type 1 TsaB [Candidatus Dependentiae bacterium]|nr:tRNA (adenosine(37)-N6)-threonylcarbamoyltransferase complex dimerization subunit type 1 TsaB [Candidatus Dependentiae bacterium]MBU4387190.1 tRNA (adenosine(37)-N6)-threonylcarbamoyltransferase complex dimerization subunit type 1 TsaB [Candidatus Dependentiae bacterium]MCG2756170.1 tRNA (adenosine(37)-N6)-threonylcarbamoyltransferase complex dimerization subunit type 1 TsaB [Candidatus Dependentiae bacterium]